MFEEGEYSSSTAAMPEAECYSTLDTLSRNKSNNKRRFTDDQIKLLETMFEHDTKLEPRKKLQVAKQLGLQPRQIAIWFQNKRARYKSKQLEKDYSILQAKYDNLASQFEILKKEKQSLVIQARFSFLCFFIFIPKVILDSSYYSHIKQLIRSIEILIFFIEINYIHFIIAYCYKRMLCV